MLLRNAWLSLNYRRAYSSWSPPWEHEIQQQIPSFHGTCTFTTITEEAYSYLTQHWSISIRPTSPLSSLSVPHTRICWASLASPTFLFINSAGSRFLFQVLFSYLLGFLFYSSGHCTKIPYVLYLISSLRLSPVSLHPAITSLSKWICTVLNLLICSFVTVQYSVCIKT
jgi:hypothetical protein